MEEGVENEMNLSGVNFGLPFSSRGTSYLFQEASYLHQLSYTSSHQHSFEKQDDNKIEWTKNPRRASVNGLIGNKIKSFMWERNFDVGKQMFNNFAELSSHPSVDAVSKDHVWKEICSREYQNLIQQEAYCPQAWQDDAQDFLSSTLTPISHAVDMSDSPAFCSSNLQSAEHDLLMASCMSYNMLLTGSSANKSGGLGGVLSPVSVSHVPRETVDSPEPFSSVTVCSDGEWNDNKEAYEDGLMNSDSSLPCIPESVSESLLEPQYSDVGELNLRDYGGYLGSNQASYHENVPALHGQSVESSHLNHWTSKPDVKLVSEDNTLPTAISYQRPNLRSHGCSVEQDAPMSNVSIQRSSLPGAFQFSPEHLHSIQQRDFRQLQNGSSNESGCDVYRIGSANLSTSDNISLHDILALYINYDNVAVNAGRIQVPFMNYLHSTVCNGKKCCCDRNSTLISHFENCQCAGCSICRPVRELHPTEAKNSAKNVVGIIRDDEYNGFSSYVNEAALPPSKRKRVENLPMFRSGSPQFTVAGHLSLGQYSEGSICSKKNKREISNKIASCGEYPNTTGESFTNGTENSEIDNSPGMCLDRLSILPSEFADDQREEKSDQTTSATISDLTESKATYHIEMRSEDPKRLGVSLTDFFTVEQLKNHLHSLSPYNQVSTGNMTMHSIRENTCQLCGLDRLVFVPTPIYCSSCLAHIKRNLVYYWMLDEAGARHCFCTKCFRESRGDNVSSQGLLISKQKFQKAKNNEQNEESWVLCDKCECWQHQICALYNDKKDLEGQAKYICPLCCLKETEVGERVPLPAALGAQDLPRSMLSDHIEQRLFRRLKLERNERSKLSRQDVDEVPDASDLIVRVALSVNKRLRVKQQFLDLFQNENYPPEFQYRSKVILLFQNIEGVDVCLFGMYVQEFGSACAPPNKRCVYISYLDSIKYFRPEIRTLKGEALRTVVYHEILIGYLDYCKKRGFTTCYIWACPPVKGEDYILYCHPESQKTPKPDKLRLWYRAMLRKASEEDIVVDYTNLYDHFFIPSARNNAKITAARLPYFDGDYWSGAAEDLIRNIEKESRGDSLNKVKKLMTKRALKAIRHNNLSADVTKDILVMQKLGQTILPVKEDFIIVNLHVVCTNCHEAILSGSRWFCDQCRNFNLCERCLALKENLGEQNTHTSSSGEHVLSEVVVDYIPTDTEDGDTTMDNDLFENRHSFLRFCQENHYQFDTLRRAKHSSMMILYHLYKKIHLSKTDSGYGYEEFEGQRRCEVFEGQRPLQKTDSGYGCEEFERQRRCEEFEGQRPLQVKLLGVLVHASQCCATPSNPCPYSGCLKIRKLFQHASRCNVRVPGGCELCYKTWSLLHWHSQTCQNFSCLVPRCMDIKKHVARNSSVQREDGG